MIKKQKFTQKYKKITQNYQKNEKNAIFLAFFDIFVDVL